MKIVLRSLFKKIIKNMQLLLMVLHLLIRKNNQLNNKVAFVFNVSNWKKRYLIPYLKGFDIKFVPLGESLWLLNLILRKDSNLVFAVWGYNNDTKLSALAEKYKVPIYRIEDGFLRSVQLGAMHAPPFSLCIDKKGMYFDSTKPSELEDILNHFDFNSNPDLLLRAKKCIQHIDKFGVSKYNHVEEKDTESVYGPKTNNRILVIGQVEDDASITKGCDKKWTNNDLVRLARDEHPDAELFYKPHPDVLTGRRPMQSNPKDIEHIAKVISEPLSISDALKTIDHVYTITSLAGFEAIIRDIPVTTVGAPFYSGWGLTDDRQPLERRKRTLTKTEVFAGAYILYPTYINPYTQKSITIEEAISSIASS